MGKKENFFAEICYKEFGAGNHLKPSSREILNSKYREEINSVYKKIGGILEIPSTRIGKYDINLMDFIIELDEENHFNRYRKTTLDSNFYAEYRLFDTKKYNSFCDKYEGKCLTYGNYWNNTSSDKQFGGSSINGCFDGNGSSRFKQRAFYDFIKDITSQIIKIPVIRISIYDTYNYFTIQNLIHNKEAKILLNYIKEKLILIKQ